MTRLRCLDCQDGRHTGSVPVGSLLAMPLPGLRPPPFQARLFSHA